MFYISKAELYNKTKRLRIIHDYYKANPNSTVEDAATFIPETETMVLRYLAIRNECTDIIRSVNRNL